MVSKEVESREKLAQVREWLVMKNNPFSPRFIYLFPIFFFGDPDAKRYRPRKSLLKARTSEERRYIVQI